MNVFITGAKSGIGLELVNQYLLGGDSVIASGRDAGVSDDLLKLREAYPAHLSILDLDVTEPESIQKAAIKVMGKIDKLDIIINSVGIYDEPLLGQIAMNDCMQMFKVNAFGPLLVIQALMPILDKKTGKIANISGGMGSITNVSRGGHYNYSASKATLNMYTKILSKETDFTHVIVLTIDPGWVRTRLGGPDAPLSVEESAACIRGILANSSPLDSGKFLDIAGREIPW